MVRYIQIKLLEDETSLREYANASEIYIEITIFCENDVVVRDTTWLKNIDQFAELIRFLSDKELKKYTVNFLDNPIEIIFMKSDGYVEYKVKSLHGERNCKINIIDLKNDIIFEIEKTLEKIKSKDRRFMRDPFIQKIYGIISKSSAV